MTLFKEKKNIKNSFKICFRKLTIFIHFIQRFCALIVCDTTMTKTVAKYLKISKNNISV